MKRNPSMIRDLRQNASGASAVEFALILPILVILTTAALDFGGLIYTRLQVGSATHAGASFAAAQGFNETGIAAAMAGGASIAITAATPVQVCGCPDAVSGIGETACGSTCTSGELAGKYVKLDASASYPLIYSWPGLSNPVTLTSTARVRIP
jgi:Flp pilus assembly protein TadG